MLAGFLITMGTVDDRIGRRRLLMIGAAAFGAASLLAAFATSVAMLIVARVVLGIAAATLAPSTLSLIRNMFLASIHRFLVAPVVVGLCGDVGRRWRGLSAVLLGGRVGLGLWAAGSIVLSGGLSGRLWADDLSW